jgi:hypothetical protein
MATNLYKIYDSCVALCAKIKTNIIAFEYPGFIDSDKTAPSEQGCYDNISTMITYMINTMGIDAGNIYLVGYSLGTGIVADYAARNTWSTNIMLISPYKTILSVAFKGCSKNPYYKSNDMFETVKKVDKIKCPVMIVHSEADTIINIKHGKSIYNKLPNPMTPLWLNNFDHTDVINNIPHDTWSQFLSKQD